MRFHCRRPLWTLGLLLLLAAREESCAITAGPNGLCASFQLEPSNVSLGVGETLQIHVNSGSCVGSCSCGTGSAAAVRWESDSPAIAAIDATGGVTGVRPGSAVITRTVGEGADAVRASMRVTVVP